MIIATVFICDIKKPTNSRLWIEQHAQRMALILASPSPQSATRYIQAWCPLGSPLKYQKAASDPTQFPNPSWQPCILLFPASWLHLSLATSCPAWTALGDLHPWHGGDLSKTLERYTQMGYIANPRVSFILASPANLPPRHTHIHSHTHSLSLSPLQKSQRKWTSFLESISCLSMINNQAESGTHQES